MINLRNVYFTSSPAACSTVRCFPLSRQSTCRVHWTCLWERGKTERNCPDPYAHSPWPEPPVVL